MLTPPDGSQSGARFTNYRMIYMRVCGIRAAIRHAVIASGLTAATLTVGALPADAATTGWRFFAPVPAGL